MSDQPGLSWEVGDDGQPRVSLNARGEFELARAAGFDTYDDFVRWKREEPDEYEAWYAEMLRKAE